MRKERYCSRVVAELLANNGFNDDYPKGDCMQIAATQQMAIDWIAEKFGLFIYAKCIDYMHGEEQNILYVGLVLDMRHNCQPIGTPASCKSFETISECLDEMMEYVLEKLIVEMKRK